ncbi:hypothetical protein RIF29_38962 [Crotalaria pallida]|uniref:Uncharacterized protein n=1 Tax=Crotalaria pallida TaxID=3830 RepID=A0AAN9E090_CROPI
MEFLVGGDESSFSSQTRLAKRLQRMRKSSSPTTVEEILSKLRGADHQRQVEYIINTLLACYSGPQTIANVAFAAKLSDLANWKYMLQLSYLDE